MHFKFLIAKQNIFEVLLDVGKSNFGRIVMCSDSIYLIGLISGVEW